jgi:hypothetical protein
VNASIGLIVIEMGMSTGSGGFPESAQAKFTSDLVTAVGMPTTKTQLSREVTGSNTKPGGNTPDLIVHLKG